MKKRHFYRDRRISKDKLPILSALILIILLCIFVYLIFVFINEFFMKDVGFSGELNWRSSMFPENWQPIDKIGAVEGLNIFTDPEGTKDPNGNTVTSGPNYHPKRFLHDFSYAGYQKGEKPIPSEDLNSWTRTAKVYNVVTQYGCVPDGNTDCRAAIQAAIDAAESAGGGVIYLPAGEYKIISAHPYYFLKIRTSKIVIRGDGADKTKIKVDPYMAGVFDMDNKMVFSVEYKVNNINQGWDDTIGPSVLITKDLPYPTKIIPVADVSSFKVGDPIAIQEQYTDATLRDHDMVNVWPVGYSVYIWRRTITAIDAVKKEISIDVPTRYRVKASENAATVAKTNPGLSEIGFEHFSIGMIRHPDEWPDNDDSTSPIVLAMTGNKVFYMYNVENGWIYDLKSYRPSENANRPTSNTKYGSYDIEILNNVLYAKDSRLVTAKDFYFKNMQVDGNPGGGYGYAFQLFRTNDILVENGTFQKVKKGSAFNQEGGSGNVIKDVVYKEIFTTENDFHSYLSASNLIDNNDLQGTYWEAAIRPIELLSVTGGTHHGHGTTQTVFWNTKGAALTIPVLDWWDRDNDNDNIRDENEAHGAIPDPGIIVSNQYGWGYIIGTYGSFSDVITARMADRMLDLNANGKSDDDVYRPYILPRDYKEGIGYDKAASPYYGKILCPRSLYEAQLALRLGKTVVCSTATTCTDGDNDGYNATSGGVCGTIIDCDDSLSGAAIHPGAQEICGDGIDNDCTGGDLTCPINPPIIVDNIDSGFSTLGTWVASGGQNEYGGDSVYSRTLGEEAIWSIALSPGVYDVYAWWTYWPSRSQNAPYLIYGDEGTTPLGTVRVNQRSTQLNSTWNLLGSFTFNQAARIVLRVETNDSYNADAISFVKIKDIQGCTPTQEVCDNLDNDCDGIVDNGVKITYFKDNDMDTYGYGAGVLLCQDSAAGYVQNNLDCDDTNNKLTLKKPCQYDSNMLCGSYSLCVESCPLPPIEICGNGIDEDCDSIDAACTTASPVLNVSYPKDGRTYKNKLVPLVYNATNAYSCFYILNSNRADTLCDVKKELKLNSGDYTIQIKANNTAKEVSEIRNFKVLLTRRYLVNGYRYIEEGLKGSLENYSDGDLENIQSLKIALPGYGQIEFLENVNLTQDANKITDIIDIDNNVEISFNRIEIKSDVLSSLNKKARLTLEGLSFNKPMILKDDNPCTDCVIESYSNGNLIFSVAGFSVYSTMETPVSNDGGDEGEGGDGGSNGGIIISSSTKNKTSSTNKTEIGLKPKVQEIEITEETKFFSLRNKEEFLLIIGGEDYIASLEINKEGVKLKVAGQEYLLSEGQILKLQAGNTVFYGVFKDMSFNKAIIGMSLDLDNLKKELGEVYAKDRKNFKYTLIFSLILLAGAIFFVSTYLIRTWKSYSSNKIEEKQQDWTKEKRFVIKEAKGRGF